MAYYSWEYSVTVTTFHLEVLPGFFVPYGPSAYFSNAASKGFHRHSHPPHMPWPDHHPKWIHTEFDFLDKSRCFRKGFKKFNLYLDDELNFRDPQISQLQLLGYTNLTPTPFFDCLMSVETIILTSQKDVPPAFCWTSPRQYPGKYLGLSFKTVKT